MSFEDEKSRIFSKSHMQKKVRLFPLGGAQGLEKTLFLVSSSICFLRRSLSCSGVCTSPWCPGAVTFIVPLEGMGASSGILVWAQSGMGAVGHLLPLMRVAACLALQVYVCARRFEPAKYDAALDALRAVGYG